jgi:ribonuclease R
MARKYARWAKENLNNRFNARITSTDIETKAEIHDEIIGAKVDITSSGNYVLFQNVTIEITKVDIYKAKIEAIVIEEENV